MPPHLSYCCPEMFPRRLRRKIFVRGISAQSVSRIPNARKVIFSAFPQSTLQTSNAEKQKFLIFRSRGFPRRTRGKENFLFPCVRDDEKNRLLRKRLGVTGTWERRRCFAERGNLGGGEKITGKICRAARNALCTAKLILYTQGVEMGQDIIVFST